MTEEAAAPVQPHPRGFEFNEEQNLALNSIRQFIDGKETYFGLFGYAGTGKTSVIQQIVTEYDKRVALSAYTHKAVGVLTEMASKYGGITPELATVASLLRLRPKKRGGEVTYEPDRRREPPIRFCDLIVVDECSMIDTNIFGLINSEVGGEVDFFESPKKVIFMGDPLQLPPVNDRNEESVTFKVPDQFTLSRVMRYGGVIGNNVDRIRENIQDSAPQKLTPGSDELGEVVVLENKRHWYEEFLRRWENDASIKALCFTNAAVAQANGHFRAKLYGFDAPPFVVGEQVVATEAYAPPPEDSAWYDSFNADVKVRTESQGQILEVNKTVHCGLSCWRLKIFFPQEGEGRSEIVHALDSAQHSAWQSELNQLRREKDWKRFWPLKESFISLRPAFATTIHKSQGSTYESVFLDYTNIIRAAGSIDPVYRNRLLYVGASRASKSLMVFDST